MTMNDDIYLALSATQDGKVKTYNKATGKEFECVEPIFISGRITQNGTNILARTPKGLFFTPVLFSEPCTDDQGYKTEKLYGLSESKHYQSDGRTEVVLPTYKDFNLSKLRLPTLISNIDNRAPMFFRLVAYGENAMRLSTIPKGSDLTIEGEFKKYWIGDQSIDVVLVKELRFNKKGAIACVGIQ